MPWSFRIGSLLGFPIRVHVTLLLFLGIIFTWGGGWFGLLLIVAVFASVIAHELGHALVARSAGLPIIDISLYPFGGMARMLVPPRTAAEEIRMAIAGPVVSLTLGVFFLVAGWLSDQTAFLVLTEINMMLGVFNLIPALPMDGGRVLRAYLARKMGYYRATSIAIRVALALAVIGALCSLWLPFYSLWLLLLAFFVMFMAFAEDVSARARRYMGDPGYKDIMSQPEAGPPITRTDWEVILPSDVRRPPPSSGNNE